jgi:hypothetical protein
MSCVSLMWSYTNLSWKWILFNYSSKFHHLIEISPFPSSIFILKTHLSYFYSRCKGQNFTLFDTTERMKLLIACFLNAVFLKIFDLRVLNWLDIFCVFPLAYLDHALQFDDPLMRYKFSYLYLLRFLVLVKFCKNNV